MNIWSLLGFNNEIATDILEEFKRNTEGFFTEYFCHRDEELYGSIWDKTYDELKHVRLNFLCKIRPEVRNFKSNYMSKRNLLHGDVVEYNNKFVAREKLHYKAFFSSISGRSLDEQQKDAVVTDEDHNLVIAGAGSGKTLTISAKVKYLYSIKNVKCEDILLLSFTRKAAEEMTDRIKQMGIPMEASTFHKLGLGIITQAENERLDVNDNVSAIVKDYFRKEIVNNPELIKKLIMFFGFYLEIPADAEKFGTLGECYEFERGREFETIRHKMGKDEFVAQIRSEKGIENVTIKGERVKSREETMIANYLFLNGVDYIYEPLYPFQSETDKKRKPYRPDFYLPKYDLYLEHFGINREGMAPWLTEAEETRYIQGIKWKQELHSKKDTKLAMTYSYYVSEGILFSEIDKIMRKYGVEYKEPDYWEIFTTVYASLEDKYFLEFLKLCETFIVLFKSNGYKPEELQSLKMKSDRYATPFHVQRTQMFLEIIEPLLKYYTKVLDDNRQVDFSDMINRATDELNSGKVILRYKYVIVDEFQDMSMARFKLVKAILDQTGAKLLCVGDDWQSIYRFAGSDIDLFTKFENYFGYTATLYIEKTYRNSQELIDLTGKFVMKNPAQKTKNLRSGKSQNSPLRFVETLDIKLPTENERFSRCGIIDSIIKEFGEDKTIMMLGRTNHDIEKIKDMDCWTLNYNKDGTIDVKYKASPKTPITFLTVHKSKGMEADNVILLNFSNDLLGFPNKISDDPLLELVLSGSDTYPYAEERRLLYVALTRTRNLSYVWVDKNNPSEFYNDFQTAPPPSLRETVNCPRCQTGRLVKREANGREFAGCSNYPQCDYTVNDVSVLYNPTRCNCGGFLITKTWNGKDFLTCSNYPDCPYYGNKGDSTQAEPSDVTCPRCKTGKLIKREYNYREFVGCTNYPQCDFTVNDMTILTNPEVCKCGGYVITKKYKGKSYTTCTNFPNCPFYLEEWGYSNNGGTKYGGYKKW